MTTDAENTANWYPFDSGSTLGTLGSESGSIIRDEEHPAGARITLERGATNAPFAITCGIYGRFFHTVYLGSESEAALTIDAMKSRLGALAVHDGDIYEELVAFTNQFP